MVAGRPGSCHKNEIAEDEHQDHSHHESDHEIGEIEKFEHFYFSHLKSPIVHSFGVEAAFTGRDLFFTCRFRDAGDGIKITDERRQPCDALTVRSKQS